MSTRSVDHLPLDFNSRASWQMAHGPQHIVAGISPHDGCSVKLYFSRNALRSNKCGNQHK